MERLESASPKSKIWLPIQILPPTQKRQHQCFTPNQGSNYSCKDHISSSICLDCKFSIHQFLPFSSTMVYDGYSSESPFHRMEHFASSLQQFIAALKAHPCFKARSISIAVILGGSFLNLICLIIALVNDNGWGPRGPVHVSIYAMAVVSKLLSSLSLPPYLPVPFSFCALVSATPKDLPGPPHFASLTSSAQSVRHLPHLPTSRPHHPRHLRPRQKWQQVRGRAEQAPPTRQETLHLHT